MPFVVDGDNLLGTWRGRGRTAEQRRQLVFALQRFARRARRRVVAVFDGPTGASTGPDVRVASAGTSADEIILQLVRDEPDPSGWTVVTSDRPLGDRCRHAGARVERCHRFRRRLIDPGDAEKPEREEDVDYWLGKFEEP